MKEEAYEEYKEKKADYNSADRVLDRIDEIKISLGYAKMNDKYDYWIKLLFVYLSEIAPQMTRDREQNFKDTLRKARQLINQPNANITRARKDSVYDTLFDVECDLERFYDLMGNKFRYQETQEEVTVSEEELNDLKQYGGGDSWVSMTKEQ